jgi:hypothetical protein
LLEFHGFGWMNAWGASADAVGQSNQIYTGWLGGSWSIELTLSLH